MTAYYPREMRVRLERACKSLPVVVLSGLRQSGKSTLLQQERILAHGHAYKTLDDFATLMAARSQPAALLEAPIVLDEVQRCPELLLAVKCSVDEQRIPGKYILSGSANLALLKNVSESLAGRAGYYTLYPLTRRERFRRTGAEPFLVSFLREQKVSPQAATDDVSERDILLGGLPPACLADPEGASEWFRSYVQTYVERDVRQLSQITDLVAFRTLVQLAAHRTAQVLGVSALARDAKLNAVTASRYLDLLETSFLVRKVPPFLRNRSSRLIKSPKLYFTDSGLACWLCGLSTLAPGRDLLLRGAMHETYVAQNLFALLEAHLPDATLFFWHEQGRYEVDFVIESGQTLIAVEVKAGTQWAGSDLVGLRAFMERTPDCAAGVLLYNGKESVQIGPHLYAIPMSVFLS